MDSPSHDRNPSPPPEIAEHSDLISEESIGNTAFSKHWLFSTLMKLIEEVDRENKEIPSAELAVDVDDELQSELCKLWDMSMNSEVAQFLNEFKAVDILTEVIQKSKAPRVTEICVGILGNMACEKSVCKMMSESPKLIDLVLLLMETRDAPTLVENTRLMYTSLSNSQTRGPWIRAIQRSEDVLNHLMFIFSSSTNCDLLKNSAELVDVLLDLEPDLCISWATVAFIHSLLEATEQIGSNHHEALEVYLHIFQSFSTTEPGVEALVETGGRLTMKIMKYLNVVCEYEIVSVDQKEDPLTAALSVLNILITTLTPEQLGDIFNSEKLMRIMLKILEPLYPMLQGYRLENQSGTSPSEEPTVSQETDQVTSSDQSEIAASREEPEAKVAEDKSEEVTSTEKKAINSTKEREKEEQHKQLEVLYEILNGLLIDYCAIVFKDSVIEGAGDTGDHPDVQGKTTNPDSTSHDMIQDDLPDSNKGDNSLDSKEEQDNTISDGAKTNLSKGDESNLSKGDNADISSSIELRGEKTGVETESGEKVRVISPVNCLPILKYLEEACSRCRINYLTLYLKETEQGTFHFDKLLLLAKKHEKSRLCRIFGDVVAGKIVKRAESGKVEDVKSMR